MNTTHMISPHSATTLVTFRDQRSRLVILLICLILLSTALILSGCSRQASLDSGKPQLASTPVLNPKATLLDFDYPSRPPSLLKGKKVFETHCAKCHTASGFQSDRSQENFLYATPIDMYLLLTTGEAPVLKGWAKSSGIRKEINLEGKTHPAFSETLTRDQRWEAVFYARHLAGASDIKHAATNDDPTVAAVFGGNCAVCHGNEGNANGFLHTGHPSNHELEGGKIHSGIFQPAPARFTQYDRMYNRTDAQLFKYIAEGLYPSGMPAWLGNVDKDKRFAFDETLVWMLVKQVRTYGYKADLPSDAEKPTGLVPQASLYPPLDLKIPPVSKLRENTASNQDQPRYFEHRQSHMPLFNNHQPAGGTSH